MKWTSSRSNQSDAKLILKILIWELSQSETGGDLHQQSGASQATVPSESCVLSISSDLAGTIRHYNIQYHNMIYRSTISPRQPTRCAARWRNFSQNINVKCYSPSAKSHQYQDIYQSFCGKLCNKIISSSEETDTNNPFCSSIKYKYNMFYIF